MVHQLLRIIQVLRFIHLITFMAVLRTCGKYFLFLLIIVYLNFQANVNNQCFTWFNSFFMSIIIFTFLFCIFIIFFFVFCWANLLTLYLKLKAQFSVSDLIFFIFYHSALITTAADNQLLIKIFKQKYLKNSVFYFYKKYFFDYIKLFKVFITG